MNLERDFFRPYLSLFWFGDAGIKCLQPLCSGIGSATTIPLKRVEVCLRTRKYTLWVWDNDTGIYSFATTNVVRRQRINKTRQ